MRTPRSGSYRRVRGLARGHLGYVGYERIGKLATTEASAASPGRRAIFMQNLEAIPSYLAGFVGYRIGPGWNDVSYAGTVSYGALIVVCAVICWALVSLTWRKAVSSFVILGAIVGVPVVIGVQGRFSNVEFYQPRYMLPLFAVFMLMLLAPPSRAAPRARRFGADASSHEHGR